MKRTIFSMMALLLGSVAGCGSNTTTPNNGPCAAVTCAADQFCDAASGACKTASVCASASCGAGSVCDGTAGSPTAGMCVQIPKTCGASQCTGGQVCDAVTAACVNPGVPALGIQIDRMGRPAVNTALTNPYDLLPAAKPETSDTTKARYNADAATSGATLVGTWAPYVAANLAILDGLDGGACGNQLAYNITLGGTNMPFYTFLSSVLASDALLIDSSKTSCTQYLGVEATALGVAGVPANECGGRKLDYDVIDRTYSVLASGMLSGVTDNIAQTTAPLTAFPYFAPPQ